VGGRSEWGLELCDKRCIAWRGTYDDLEENLLSRSHDCVVYGSVESVCVVCGSTVVVVV